ncbi:MAG: MarR family transcriptional regulator [Methanomassiliicoccales archaeon]
MLSKSHEREDYEEANEMLRAMNCIIKQWRRYVNAELNNLGISPIHLKILEFAEEHEGYPLSSIAQESGVTGAWVTNVVAQMVKDGYLVKKKGRNDRRKVTIRVTPDGKRMLEQGRESIAKILAVRLNALSVEDREQLLSLLKRIEERLSASQ